jgi:hypothetical protein
VIARDATFDPPAAVLALVRDSFTDGDYRLEHMAEEVGAKLAPEAWAMLVQEVGKPMALDVFGAFVLRAIEHEAQRLEMEAKFAEYDAERHRAYAAALRWELDRSDLELF